MIILQKIIMHSSRAKIILELSKKQTLGHGLQSSALLQSTFALLSHQVAVENTDNFSDVSMDDEEKDPNWTGDSDIPNPFELSDEKESNEAVEKQQIAYDQEVIGERVRGTTRGGKSDGCRTRNNGSPSKKKIQPYLVGAKRQKIKTLEWK